MDRRHSLRIAVLLPVRIWGVDAYARPFMHLAHAKNISATGAVVKGVPCQVLVGEIVDVQCGEEKAQFRVVWVGQPDSRAQREIGIQCLPAEPLIWVVNLRRCAQLVGKG